MRTAASSKNPVERLGAVVAFRYCEALAEADAELLLALLKDDDAAVRSYAMFAIQGRDGYKPSIEAILIPMLDEPKLHAFALESLIRVASKDSPGFDKLVEALPQAAPQQRVWLAMAIRRIDPQSQVALQTLTALLRETETPSGWTYHSSKLVHSQRINTWHASQHSVAASAAEYLAEIGSAAAPAVPQLIAALESKERDLRSNAIEALGSIGRAARAAIEPLRKLLASDEWTRAAALDALCKIDPEGGWEKQRPKAFTGVAAPARGISISEGSGRADGSSAAAKAPSK
jgi:HEAT repeat protein